MKPCAACWPDRYAVAGSLLLALIAGKPEQLILLDGTADGKAVLIAFESVTRKAVLIVEIGIGAEGIIAIEFENGAMH